jgi:hypothetical protein
MSQLHVLNPRLPVGEVSGPHPLLHATDVASQLVILSTRPAGQAPRPPASSTLPPDPELELPAPELLPELLELLELLELDPAPLLELLLDPPPLLELLLEPVCPPPELLLEPVCPPPELELEELELLEFDAPLLLELEKPGLPLPPLGVLLQAETTVPPTSAVAAHTYT